MINKYVWELYKKSEDGQRVIMAFQKAFEEGLTEEYIDILLELKDHYCADKHMVEDTRDQLFDLLEWLDNNQDENADETYEEDISDIDALFKDFYDAWLVKYDNDIKDAFCDFAWMIESISTDLTIGFPDVFFPYYFYYNYIVLELIAGTFDISLPEIPPKSDYEARARHYIELCKVMHRFRTDNDLSLYEFCAFLYDFAPKYIGGTKSYIIDEFPEAPKSAFFIGGGGNNGDELAENDKDTIVRWQCSPDTRAGDMIVMYLRTPISSISSIWRACSVGFIDPFFWHYRCTYIGKPVKIKRISISAIKKDKVLGKMPIVLKNLQGINGVELKPSQYNHIVELTKAPVPLLECVMEEGGGTYENEKAVEDHLIKKMLSKLGYSENEYKRQLYIEIGNHNHALIPDFVLLPVVSKGHYSGFAIIEAKRSITTNKQLEDAKSQARSYAKMVGAKYSSVASQEGIWVTSSRDDYEKDVYSATWEKLKEEDEFYKLQQLIGNR